MSQLSIITASLINSMIFTSMKHPMSMGVMLLLQTLLICMITSSMAQTPWFSYILFLVFLGGMMVLFIYMTSVASNDLFQNSTYMKLTTMVITTTIILSLLLMIDPMMMFNNTNEMLMTSPHYKISKITYKMFNYPTNIMTTYAVLYLFLTLIVVVKITALHQGPLRSKY